jgi:hypothetical protein
LRPDESVARGSCFITVKRVKREPGQPRFGREIGVKLWPDLQRLEREGKSLQQILDWLLQEHQIKTSKPTLSRLLGEIREAAPIEPVPPLEPASEEDELKIIRQLEAAPRWRVPLDPSARRGTSLEGGREAEACHRSR